MLRGRLRAPAFAQPPEQVHGPQERVGVHLRPERERREERRHEPTQMPVPLPKEVEAAIFIGAGDPTGCCNGLPEKFGWDSPVDGASELGVVDCGVEHDAGQLAEELDRLVDGLRHGAAKVLQVAAGPRVSLGQAAIELVDRLVGDVNQRLVEEGHQKRIPPFLRHPLQGLAGGPTSDLGQAFDPVGTQAAEGPSRDTRTLEEFELLDVAQDGLRRVGDGRAAEPGQRDPSAGDIGDQQAVEQGLGAVGQEGSQEAEGLVLGLLLGGDHHPFEAGQSRPHDLVDAESSRRRVGRAGSIGRVPGPGRRART